MTVHCSRPNSQISMSQWLLASLDSTGGFCPIIIWRAGSLVPTTYWAATGAQMLNRQKVVPVTVK